MVPTIEGEFARKRRMMPGPLRRGRPRRDARPARLRPAVRVRDRQPSGASLRLAAPAPDRARRQPRAARRRRRSTRSRSPPRPPLLAAAALAGRAPRAPVAARALLRADDRLDRRRALGPGPAAGRRGRGRRRRGRGERGSTERSTRTACRGRRTWRSRRWPSPSPLRCWRSRRSRSSSTRAGPVVYRSPPRRARRAWSSTSTSCARCTPAATRSGSGPRCSRATRG